MGDADGVMDGQIDEWMNLNGLISASLHGCILTKSLAME